MHVIPCELCGYDAPASLCPHCRGVSAETSFARGKGRITDLRAGLSALPRGLGYLASTPRTKRWLVPPFLLTTLAFGLVFVWAWNRFQSVIAFAGEEGERASGVDASWWQRFFEAVLQSSAFLVLAKLGSVVLFLVVGFFAALYTFSLFYEAISGPFLDEVQGRIEKRWFGVDPRNAIQRPTELSAGKCAVFTTAAAAFALVLAYGAWHAGGGLRWWLLLGAVLVPFAGLSLARRDYGRWLAWALRVEAVTLWTSVRTSLVALTLLVFCLPLKFVPFVGPVIFAAVAGFATSISLLDIPFSRRSWTLGQRLAFVRQHLLPLVAFGAVSSLVFLVPFAGPILMVPAASIGGLWLVVRLDKTRLRQESARRAARLAARDRAEAAARP